MSNSTFFDQQIGVYGEQAESWKVDHAEAMQCRDLEELIRFGLYLHGGIIQSPSDSDKITVHDVGRRFWLLQEWHRRSLPFLDAIARMEAKNFAVDGAAEFRKAVVFASASIGQMQRVAEGAQSILNGQGIVFPEGFDDLQGDSSADCSRGASAE